MDTLTDASTDTLSILEQIINENPITKESVNRFVSDHLSGVRIHSLAGRMGGQTVLGTGHTWYSSRPWSWDKSLKFLFFIDPNYGFDESCVTFLHELSHVLYGHWELKAYDAGTKHNALEDTLDNEAKRFYEDNKQFVREIVAQFYAKEEK